jgi:glycosyltransferase involved in cell wall biosynthesis
MPMVLLEAGAAGLPIVATAVGGNREVVRHEESGFLVPASDPDALGQAMLRLMNLPESRRRSMGEAGREHVRSHYGLGKMVEQWEDLYRGVLARKGLALAPALSR